MSYSKDNKSKTVDDHELGHGIRHQTKHHAVRSKRLSGIFARIRGIHDHPRHNPAPDDRDGLCRVCQLFLSVASKSSRHQHVDLNLFYPLIEYHDENDKCMVKIDDQSLADLLRNRSQQNDNFDPWLGSGDLLDVEAPILHSTCSGSVVDATSVNYDAIGYWLKTCLRDHSSTCGRHSSPGMQLYAIDCFTYTIVPLPPRQSYVALSYVWGSLADPTGVSTSGRGNKALNQLVESDLPLTVKDAVQVVKRIGQRFLWVDRYCIPQSNSQQKRDAILNMNLVYAGADLTIIALHGDSINSGLPGVSTQHRSGGSRQFAIPSARVVSTLPHFTDVIRESTWATRAWTYQEARLSRRCLFFAQYQTYFACHEETLSEAVHAKPSSASQIPLHMTGLLPSTFSSIDAYNARGYFLDRLVYTQKSLTYPEDILDAFRGLLRQHPFVTFWGVPILRDGMELDPCVGFAMGLLWQRRGTNTSLAGSGGRRPGFPTWSWTSIYGPVFQDDRYIPSSTDYEKFLMEKIPSNGYRQKLKPCFTIEIPPDGIALSELIASTKGNILPETTQSLIVQGEVVSLRRHKRWNTRSFEICHANGNRIFAENTPRLNNGYFDTTADEMVFDHEVVQYPDRLQDALILMDWPTKPDIPHSNAQFVLLLLKWVGDGVAERIGLLRETSHLIDMVEVNAIPRRRMKFELR